MGVELTDMFITLKPRSEWTRASTQDELTELVQKTLRELPGQRIAMTQPIEMRLNEMISGVRSDVAVKLFGDDFDVLVDKAQEIERVLKSIDGNADVNVEQITGQPVLQIVVKQDEIARYGVSATEVLNLVESLGSFQLGEVYEDQLRFPLVVRLPESIRSSPETIGNIEINTPSGQRIPLSRLAEIKTIEGPSTITREWGYRRITISCQHSRPGHGRICRRGSTKNRRAGQTSRWSVSHRMGRPVRELPKRPTALDAHRADGIDVDSDSAVHDVS